MKYEHYLKDILEILSNSKSMDLLLTQLIYTTADQKYPFNYAANEKMTINAFVNVTIVAFWGGFYFNTTPQKPIPPFLRTFGLPAKLLISLRIQFMSNKQLQIK